MSGATKTETLFLFSSNVRPKYFDDCVHCLMLPRGMVMHFRYLNKHVAPALLSAMQDKAASLEGRYAVASYLYLTPGAAHAPWNVVTAYPLRHGEVIRVESTGNAVHIYFRVLGLPIAAQYDAVKQAALKAKVQDPEPRVAVPGIHLDPSLFSREESSDYAAFSAIVDCFDSGHFQTYEKNATGVYQATQMDPVFPRVSGLFRASETESQKKLSRINPCSLGFSNIQPGYRLDSETAYVMEVGFSLPKWSTAEAKGYQLVLKTDADLFSNPTEDALRIASPYDKGELFIMPRKTEAGWISRATLSLESLSDSASSSVTPFAEWPIWFQSRARVNRRFSQILRALASAVPIVLATFSAYLALSTKDPKVNWSALPLVFWILLVGYGVVIGLKGWLLDGVP